MEMSMAKANNWFEMLQYIQYRLPQLASEELTELSKSEIRQLYLQLQVAE